jgi:adenylate kinase family enzyme
VVIGSTGSGKTTVARALAQRLGVPHVELDALFWQPGWVETPPDEFRARVAARLDAHDSWVVDGNYNSRLGTSVLEHADQIVWLDLPFRVTFWRLLRRTVRRLRVHELLWGDNSETFRGAFLSRDSILLFALKTYRRGRRARAQLVAGYPHVRLRSVRDVSRYLEKAA